MDKTEKRFERDIESFLISEEGGYKQFSGQDEQGNWTRPYTHDVEKCIYMDALVEFLTSTQPREWKKYQNINSIKKPEEALYTRLEEEISRHGVLHVLRRGIHDRGIHFHLCYFKPESSKNQQAWELYEKNILGCSRQFRYSPKNQNTLDMALSVNGIPVVALELKNQFTQQNVQDAIRQFQQDRDPQEKCFQPNHRFLVYFAVDLYEARMTNRLKGKDTRFSPFNQGSGGAGATGGAGNPRVQKGYATSYLWEEVLQKDSLLDLIHRFISLVGDSPEGQLIFPRYHQYDVIKKLLEDVKQKGAGTNYLIQHFAGSGKSYSIAWLAYRLASLHNDENESVFDSVIVVTNRVVLDGQLQATINSLEHQEGLVEALDESKNSRSLAAALNDNKRIIICTIQKFLFTADYLEKTNNRDFAIIVDEAHQGQCGETAKALRSALINQGVELQEYADQEETEVNEIDLSNAYIKHLLGQGRHKNQSFFAFTATPTNKTLELFGTKQADGRYGPFHVYSMRQAIEEGYILNVLSSYIVIKESFRLDCIHGDQVVPTSRTHRALIQYYKGNETTIREKTDLIMSHFLENGRRQLNGRGKAMIVADSCANAVRYYQSIQEYIKKNPRECENCGVMVAFSGEVSLEKGGKFYREAELNQDGKGNPINTDKRFRQVFHSDLFNILVVASKYQTGFDEPLLNSMYVDKKLRGVNAVQTISRLNRVFPGKLNTFVMDFSNTTEDIRQAFQTYYEETALEGASDPNILYNLREDIRKLHIYSEDEVNRFYELDSQKEQDPTDLGSLSGIQRDAILRYQGLSEEEQDMARSLLRQFSKTYSYVTQLIRLDDESLFKEFLYISCLRESLATLDKASSLDLSDQIRLVYINLKEIFHGPITVDPGTEVLLPPRPGSPRPTQDSEDTLENIINKINELFGNEDFTEEDRVYIRSIISPLMQDQQLRQYAQTNERTLFLNNFFKAKFDPMIARLHELPQQREILNKILTDKELYDNFLNTVGNGIYEALRHSKPTEGHQEQALPMAAEGPSQYGAE